MARFNANKIIFFSLVDEIHVSHLRIFSVDDVKSEISVHHLVNRRNICRSHIFLQKLKLLSLIGSSEHQTEQNVAGKQISGEVPARQDDNPASKHNYSASGLEKFWLV